MVNNYTTTHTPLTSFDPNTILPPFVSYLPRSGDPSANVHLDLRLPPSSLNSFPHPSTSENMSENMEIENESTMVTRFLFSSRIYIYISWQSSLPTTICAQNLSFRVTQI
jgi:hypothetical protein